MKKIVIIFFTTILLFGANSDDINQKLNLILQKMSELEKKVDKKDAQIEQLKQELNSQKVAIKKQKEETKKRFILNSCDNIKVSNFKYYYRGQVIPYFDLSFTITNKYPYDIRHLSGKLKVKDADGSVLLVDFIDKNILIKKDASITIDKRHIIVGDLEKTLKDEDPSTIKVTFSPTVIEFINGEKAKCGGLFDINF